MGSFPETYNDLTGKWRSMQGNPRQSWSVQSGIQYLESGVPKLNSRYQSPGFRIPLAKISRVSESRVPCMGVEVNRVNLGTKLC